MHGGNAGRVHDPEHCDGGGSLEPFRESFGESRLRAIAANILELLRSLDKPLLAELPFLVGC